MRLGGRGVDVCDHRRISSSPSVAAYGVDGHRFRALRELKSTRASGASLSLDFSLDFGRRFGGSLLHRRFAFAGRLRLFFGRFLYRVSLRLRHAQLRLLGCLSARERVVRAFERDVGAEASDGLGRASGWLGS